MEQRLGLSEGWHITPAGGATGEAYIAENHEQKLFLKRNSSPFLAVLSAEGIVPKLIWTRRMENGDVITAQQWLEGRELKASDMKHPSVANLLSKIHGSKELLDLLKRIEKNPLEPEGVLTEIDEQVIAQVSHPVLDKARVYLERNLERIRFHQKVVCHGDVNHNNWLLSAEKQLYLIDWDGAMVADPALDIGQLLYWYIPKNEWQDWLDQYGIKLSSNLEERMRWYVIAQTILSINWHRRRDERKEMENWIKYLQEIF
ncbi:phosphotransferase family protein [Bacillus solimangrovi]|uniref:Phosphotransferase n=1 Tax=Bacillus solimangrovi TaxID=1305675 RepID=A0A1E5LCH0_9BACI|nr:phosphotransferase family protein [Bacillus solimangrovi]OEH91773.1 phosphotransferase [Bacillus solimangrovi]